MRSPKSGRRAGKILRFLLAGVCVACFSSGDSQGQGTPSPRAKAAFVGKMLDFMDWPQSLPKGKDKPFRVCVFGDPHLAIALAEELRAARIGDRRVEVDWARKEEELKGCQVVFIGVSAGSHLEKALEAARGSGALTIGEAAGFLAAGGAVQLSYEDNTVQFQVNLTAARIAGVRMNARLLALAKRVARENEDPGG
ncbi:MAG TPA: YfiR family protein [Candidatus Limnocylindrales bacterium]|nr:YfiR family protein [Candidatus Limnocylindrales bacterium]